MLVIQYSIKIAGLLGYPIALIYILFFCSVLMLSLWIFGNFVTIILLPETPHYVIVFTMLFIAGYAAYNGVETIARLAQFIAFFIIIASGLLLTLSLGKLEYYHLFPQFEHGIWPAVRSSIYPGSWFGVCMMMGMLMPYHSNQNKTFTIKSSAVITGSFIMTLLLLYSILILGPGMASRLYYPIYAFSRTIHPAFLERIDVLIMLIYLCGSFITLSTLYYVGVQGFSQLLRIGTHKSFVLPVGIVILILPNLLFDNIASAYVFFDKMFPVFALIIEGGITSLLFICALIRFLFKPNT